MTFFALLHLLAFGYSDFKRAKPIEENNSGKKEETELSHEDDSIVMVNARNVFSIFDLLKDINYNFHQKYRTHVQLSHDSESEGDEQDEAKLPNEQKGSEK